MKYFYSLFFILITTLYSCENSPSNSDDNAQDFEAVKHLIQDTFDDIWSNKRAELLTKYHTEDFILLEHGEVWNNDTIANWCKRARLRDKGWKRINNFDFFKAKREGNRIWMAYHNYATIASDTLERKFQWLESIVAVKTDSIWRLELMHSTRVNKK